MPPDRDHPRITLEKSRTVRRRYQRSNKRFTFTASQIARIEREEERERRAQKLRDKDKKRVQDKKKKAEKEARLREERMKRGLPDPNAPNVPASQPLLFNFIKKTPSLQPDTESEGQASGNETESVTVPEGETETGGDFGSETEFATEFEGEDDDDDDSTLGDEDLDTILVALGEAAETTAGIEDEGNHPMVYKSQDEDEFSECSAFYDEDVIKETEAVLEQVAVATVVSTDSFQDDTAILLEEFAPEFDPVNNHQLHYADSHPDGAPSGGLTFFFIHGLGSSQNYYFPIIPYLTSQHRCITADTYGSGRSTYTDQSVSISSIAADVIGVLDALNVPQAVVVGHSMGGLVVTLLGVEHADRVKGIVAIGPTHPSETLTSVMQKRSETAAKDGMESLANAIPYQATGSAASDLAKSFIRELVLGQNHKGYAALCQAIANAPTIDYSSIKVPFLLIAGEEDKSASLEGCQYIFDNVSSANKRMEVLKQVGHWHCIEAPESVGTAIAEFVKSSY
ncbi:alpha/beta fold hydrolase [Aspergillus stella-maris]|uniref:alpha/beta fold hydrolase n=1 Tax=Aspergillus stella-maris TaxID=1810926 RepID=UPI003CCE07C5